MQLSSKHIRNGILALLALTVIRTGPYASAGPIPVDGFSIAISEDLAGVSGLSWSLKNAVTLVAQDRPVVTINNTSTVSSITAICLQLGNSTFDIGSLILPANSSGPTPSAFSPGNSASLHAGLSYAGISFSSFAAQDSYSFRVNIDRVADNGLSLTNYRQALASGSDPNQWAIINVTFSDGMTLHERLTPANISGAAQNPTYSYFQCLASAPQTGQINLQASVGSLNPVGAIPAGGGDGGGGAGGSGGEGNSAPAIPEPGTWLLAIIGVAGCTLLLGRQKRSANQSVA